MSAASLVTFAPLGDFIGGRWVPFDAPTQALVAPSDTRHVLGAWPQTTSRIDDAVESARATFARWRRLPLADRIAVLNRFADALAARRHALALAIASEVGKPWDESLAEADLLVSKIRFTCQLAPQELAAVVPDRVDGFWDLRPHGVVAVLGPFNFPMHLSNGHLAPALVAGNVAILKPSEHAPGCAQAYVEAWAEAAGEWAAALSLVQGGGSAGAVLAAHDGVDAVCFTGSYAVGVAIRRATAHQTGKLLALEMGGKNASLVFDDADLDLTVQQVVAAALQSSGQRCTATSRVIVHPRVLEPLLERLTAAVSAWPIGDPLDAQFRMGPLSTAAAQRRFDAAQSDLTGLRTLVAGGAFEGPAPGYWVRPAVHLLEDRQARPARWREELFGPELIVEVAESDAEAVARANDTPYGLAAAVFSRSHARFVEARAGIDAGLINWNRGTAGASGAMPFGGLKHSGNHRPAGALSLRYCVSPVATLLR